MCSDSEYGAMPDWDVSNVTNMDSAFYNRPEFNADISSWNVSNVVTMANMFFSAYPVEGNFNQPIGDWDVSNVTNMRTMFYGQGNFNQPIGDWDVSSVTNMFVLFGFCYAFNQPIGDWDVGNVTNMQSIFQRCFVFNQDISNWDVSNVNNMFFAFLGAIDFNQDIGDWDVGNVTDMYGMFQEAASFNQDLSTWNVSNVTDMGAMFNSSNLSTVNYDNILNSWSQQSVNQNVNLGASAFYCNSEIERQFLIDNYSWTINDAGYNCDTAGIDDLGISSFYVYPNPTTDYINIDCSSLESVFVYNIFGNELIKETSNRINVSSLSNGVYFIKVSDGVNSSTKKFIKD
jgi:surface protein